MLIKRNDIVKDIQLLNMYTKVSFTINSGRDTHSWSTHIPYIEKRSDDEVYNIAFKEYVYQVIFLGNGWARKIAYTDWFSR